MHLRTWATVFGRVSYVTLAIITSMCTFALALWIPNISLLWKVFTVDGALSTKVAFAWSLLGGIFTNNTVFSASYIIIIALLFGVYVALLAYHITTQKKVAVVQSGTGILGLLAGSLGLGCAACSTLVLSSLFTAIGGAGLISLLPLGGSEFGVIGVVLLGWSIYALVKRIESPPVCSV